MKSKRDNLDITLYVIVVPNGYAILPFHEDVGLYLHPYTGPVLTASDVLATVRDRDISLVTDKVQWDVEWTHGASLTLERLTNCQ